MRRISAHECSRVWSLIWKEVVQGFGRKLCQGMERSCARVWKEVVPGFRKKFCKGLERSCARVWIEIVQGFGKKLCKGLERNCARVWKEVVQGKLNMCMYPWRPHVSPCIIYADRKVQPANLDFIAILGKPLSMLRFAHGYHTIFPIAANSTLAPVDNSDRWFCGIDNWWWNEGYCDDFKKSQVYQ